MKDCDSAIEKLRKRQRGRALDPENEEKLSSLNDLVGVKVFAFPPTLLRQVDAILRQKFSTWTYDPFKNDGEKLGYKYVGKTPANSAITAEYQVVSTLAGKYLEVEHDAIFKPDAAYAGINQDEQVIDARSMAFAALIHFESIFEEALAAYDEAGRSESEAANGGESHRAGGGHAIEPQA